MAEAAAGAGAEADGSWAKRKRGLQERRSREDAAREGDDE